MSDELGFAFPKQGLRKLVRIYFWGSIVGVGMTHLAVPEASPWISIGCLLLVFGTLGLVSMIAVRRKVVFLSSSGIRGADSSGRKITVLWSDQVTVEGQRSHSPFFPMLRVSKEDGSHLVFPAAIAATPEFRDKLANCAPKDHVLPKALEHRRFE